MVARLESKIRELDSIDDYMEVFYENGWTDGLPVVPPTERKVRQFLDVNRLEPGAVIARFPARNRGVTAEQIAINCVMAGCKPEYMPILVAAVEAMTDPAYNINFIDSICGIYALMILSGPIVDRLGLVCYKSDAVLLPPDGGHVTKRQARANAVLR